MPYSANHPIVRAASAAASRPVRSALLAVAALAAMVSSFVAFGTSPLPPLLDLADKPLYSAGTRDKPTLTLAISVEFPTLGAQYTGGSSTLDQTYSPTNEYLGYFDTESCYQYVNDANPALRRFDRTGAATGRTCGGTGFSGNFMNWASSSAVDVLRLGLTGGDRIVDDANMTVLQRAILPTTYGGFWNSYNFPAKRLKTAHVAGAVPNNLRGSHSGDIWIANCLNRIHFGTDEEGSCGSPEDNSNLGTPDPDAFRGPVTSFTGSLPADFVLCAPRGGTCSFAGIRQVAYGRGSNWHFAAVNNSIECSNDDDDGFDAGDNSNSNNCYVRPDPTGWTPAGEYGAALTSDPFFYARVKVCESNSAGVLLDPRAADLADKDRALCAKYPNGKYKPVGQLQKNSDALRVAAFGYLLDDSYYPQRYGSVLRAPMKYVGGKAYDSTGVLINGTNPQVEWDTATGVFMANPEGAAEGRSGVINYLNQFGRTGATPGVYKIYDPVGELYYESLRYIQGLSPTPEATAGMTAAMKDGFPVYSTWTDPHAGGSNVQDYSCIRNNILAIGDVNTHNDKSIPGNTSRLANGDFARPANPAANEPDFHFWTKVVGGFESDRAVSYVDGKGAPQTTSNPNSGLNASLWGMENDNVGADRAAHYMAGMAYWANTHDIRGNDWSDTAKRRPGMRVTTYMLDVNEYGMESDANRRRKNQFFLAAKYGGFNDKSGKGNPFLDATGSPDNSSWERPADPREANNYFLSSNARAVMQALAKIFEDVAKKGSSIAGAAISTQRLVGVDGNIYQAQFDPAAWNGDLISMAVNHNTVTNVVSLAAAPTWSAAAQLDLMDPANRRIAVGKAVADSTSAATTFTWTGIEAGLVAALNKPGPSFTADGRGEDRLNYLRGDRSRETAAPSLRRRASRLGDIVNSGVAYSGAPTQGINAANYPAFYNANKLRAKALFVGANDGMLHAFNAATGDELFAYIPSWLGPKLSLLTNDNYVTNHEAYVDASPAVSEALVGSTWKTVLVGGTGGGGQGVFALDVTNPAAFDETKVMWEFTDRDDPDLGNVIGRPQIRKFRVSPPNVPAVYKWFAVVAGGVNNHQPDGFASTTAHPAMFLLDLAKPLGAPWVAGSNYFKISVPGDPLLNPTRAPGIVNFSLTSGIGDEVAHMYFGDLHGRMWKLDFTPYAASAADWTLDKLSTFKNGSTALPLFVAKDAGGTAQPITMPPNLPVGPNQSTVVVFGTGKYLETGDNVVNASTQVQSVYAILDDGTSVADDSTVGSGAISGRGRLQAGSVNGSGTVTFAPFTWGKATSNADTSKRSGWYFDMASPGERQISPGTLFGTQVVFGTVVPPNSVTDACGTGSGRQYTVSMLTGAGVSSASTVGLLGQPLVLELGAGVYTASDSTGRRTRTATAQIVLQGSGGLTAPPGSGTGQVVSVSYPGRLSWRQLSNYEELRSAP